MNVTLQLRYSPAPLREAAAWFIPGAEPRAWLAELTSWGVPLAGARLFAVMPHCRLSLRERTFVRGANDDNPAGVVVTLDKNVKPRTTLALPYGRVGAKLLVPVEAELDPPLKDAEVAALVPTGAEALLWHPAAGLVRFDSPALTVAQLLSPPPASGRNWDAGQPGIATNQRLLSIEPSERPSFEEVMQAGQGGIGTQPIQGGLPKTPGEPAGGAIGRAVASAGLSAVAGAAGLLGGAALAAAAAAGGLTRLIGGAAGAGAAGSAAQQQPPKAGNGGPNWLERLAEWARRRQQALQQNLEQLRNSQIERLLHSLQNSPDQGLRFALPLTGTGAPRGLAPPGAFLTERNINFNLGGLGGGAAADFWDLSDSYRRKLAERYRELANREISLGRHRRAAYILAHLLGDFSSAAATLANGGHFREAAVLYEERLKQPLAAARCLQRGGLLAEALAIFERLGEHEIVGDLYRQLDQQEPAEKAYTQAISKLLRAGDHLGAARLVETRLESPDDALAVLIKGWHGSTQADRCLDEAFALLARHQKHERAQALVEEEGRGAFDIKPVTLVGGLARVMATYPHDTVRDTARSATRVLVSRHLPSAGTLDSEALLRALKSTVPADRLLERDCTRYQDRRDEKERRQLAARPRLAPSRQPRPLSSFRLPWGKWRAAVSCGDEFYAAGLHNHWLIVARGRWDGAVQLPIGEPAVVPAEATNSPLFLAADPRGLGGTYLHVPPHFPQREMHFSATDKFPQPVRVGPVGGAEQTLEGLTYGLTHTLHLLTLPEPGVAQIAPYHKGQRLQGLRTVTFYAAALDEPGDDDTAFEEDDFEQIVRPLPFFARELSLYLAVGKRLFSQRGQQVSAGFGSPIRAITGSAPHTRPRIILACEQGGYVLWGHSAESPATRFSQDMHRPVVGLTRGGWLVAATRGELEVFGTHDGRLSFFGRTDDFNHDPIAILPMTAANRFAVLTEVGQVTIYEVPG